MTINPTSYRSIGNLTVWLVRLSVVSIILVVISIAIASYQILSVKYLSQSENNFTVIDTINGIISILVAIIFLFWYYRATKNIHSFGAKEVTSPRMAVIWWFIPIAFLWKPYKIAQQIWKASNPEITLTNGTEWKNSTSSKIIKIWWMLLLVSALGAGVASFIGGVFIGLNYNINSDVEVESSESTQASLLYESIQESLLIYIIGTLFLILSIISTIYFIRMVRQISTRQYQKSIAFV